MNKERTRKPGASRAVKRCRSCGDAIPETGRYEIGVSVEGLERKWVVCYPCHQVFWEVMHAVQEGREAKTRVARRRVAGVGALLDFMPL
jgi:uncharacterized protein with PIN domain